MIMMIIIIFTVIIPSVLWHCWLGGRKGSWPVKNGDAGGGHWLVRMEWRPAGWSVYLLLLFFPCTIKSRSSLLAPAHLRGPGKRAVKRLRLCGYCYYCLPSVLWHCWFGVRKSIWPVKSADVVICLERGANDLYMVQLMPLPPYHLLLH